MNDIIVCSLATFLIIYTPIGVFLWLMIGLILNRLWAMILFTILSLSSPIISYTLLYWIFEIKKGLLF
jgi:hypothetical protein